MASISIARKHHLSHKKAKDAAEQIARDLKSRFSLDYAWNGDRIDFERPGVTGSMHVRKDQIQLDVSLSFLLTPIKPCPHLLEGQLLCMWRQGSTWATSRWDPARFTSVFAVQAAWRWLACYEIWHETGEWPLPEAK